MCDYEGNIEKFNLTEDDYVRICAEKAREYVNNEENIKHFGELIKHKNVTDEELKQMGSDKTLTELIKFIPQKPLNKQYVPINFATQGLCPVCGAFVSDGIGGTDKQCNKCGQLIDWKSR